MDKNIQYETIRVILFDLYKKGLLSFTEWQDSIKNIRSEFGLKNA